MKAEGLQYQDQVEQLAKRTALPLIRSRKFIKAYRRLLKGALGQGMPINIEGLVRIYPSTKKDNFIVFEKEYEFVDQVKDLVSVLDWSVTEVRDVLRSYIQLLLMRVSMGYEIRVSGVFLMRPDYINENQIGFVIRLSPTLDKPDNVTLNVMHVYEDDEVIELPREKIVYKLEVDDRLDVPEKVRTGDVFEGIEYIDDDILG